MKVDPYATGVLTPEVHERLLPKLERFADEANILPDWIWTRLSQVCGPAEVDWVNRFKFHRGDKVSGLAYVGWNHDPPIEDRMAAIAGALIRHFINARVMTVHRLINAASDSAVPDVSCLLIPNFFLGASDIRPWQVSLLFDALLHRHGLGVQTVIYASDLQAMGVEYGISLKRHVEKHYTLLEV
jgi:hypothetical protein